MQSSKRYFIQPGRSAITALLIALVLLLNAMAACPGLHELIHRDAGQHGHECAVTLFARGSIESSVVDVPVAMATLLIPSLPQIEVAVFHAAPDALPSERAPPVASAVS